MMKQPIKHALLKACLVTVSSLMLSGCYDLGQTDTETYYNTFGDEVKLYYTDDSNSQDKDTESFRDKFYNEETVNHIGQADVVDAKYYEYLFVKVDTDGFSMENLALTFKGDGNEATPRQVMSLRVFVSKDKKIPDPDKCRGYWSYLNDGSGGDAPVYEDDFQNPIATGTVPVQATKWTDTVFEDWTINAKYAGSVSIPKDEYLIIQFLNNTGYGYDAGLKPIIFTSTNLIVSAFDPDGLAEITPTDTPDDDANDDDYDDSGEDDYAYD